MTFFLGLKLFVFTFIGKSKKEERIKRFEFSFVDVRADDITYEDVGFLHQETGA